MINTEALAKEFVRERCSANSFTNLEAFVAALKEENERQNLVSRASLDSVWQRHIADSAQLLDLVPRETPSWLDLGSGAGFPGIVISVMRPETSITLVESRRKRIDWLWHLVETLELENCHVVGARLEQVDAFPVSVITARAFAPLPKLLKLSARFSTEGTIWLLPKGRSAAQEVQELGKSKRVVFHVKQSQTDHDAGIVVGETLKNGTS